MTLAEILDAKFRADIKYRGVAYLEAERVAITRVAPDTVRALVRDGVEHQTLLSRDDEKTLTMHCSCDPFQRVGVCKHLWGTVLATDAGGFVNDAIRLGYVPPFIADTAPVSFDDDWEVELEAALQPSLSRRKSKSRKVEVALRPWEATLQQLREKLSDQGPTAGQANREREILYEIDIDRSRQTEELVIQTSQRQRRASGQWGKQKPLKLRPGRLAEIEHEDDRQIMAHLVGGSVDREVTHGRTPDAIAAHRYRVPFDLALILLPIMSESGRLRYFESADDSSPQKTVLWDDGEPWELTVQFARDAGSSLRDKKQDAEATADPEATADSEANAEPEATTEPDGEETPEPDAEDEIDLDDEPVPEEWILTGRLQRESEKLRLSDAVLVLPGGFVLTNTHIARLHDFGAFDWTTVVDAGGGLSVSDDECQEFVDRLLDMPALPRLDLPPALRLEEITCEPAPSILIQSPRGARWHAERLKCEVRFDYLGTLVAASSERWAIIQREQGRCIVRNRKFEERMWSILQELGFQRLRDKRRGSHDVEIDARRLGPAVRTLIDEKWQVSADGMSVRQPGQIKFRVESGVDWFELHADIDFGGGAAVRFPELLSALSRGDTTVRLDDGSLGIVPEEWLQQIGVFAGLGEAGEDSLRFGNNQVALLDALLSAQESVDIDARFLEMREKFATFDGVEEMEEPEGFKGELRGYQRGGLGWLKFLQEFNFGGCLADDMGLGKTVQMLAILQERRMERGKPAPSLIVVPRSLMFNWRQECERFAPTLKVMDYIGLDRAKLRSSFSEHDVILTTYGTLRRDAVSLKDYEFDYIVLDEAQTIKNPSSQVAKASRLLNSSHRIALSGTPIENHLGDLWSIFEFLNPGMLGRSSSFRNYAASSEDEQQRLLLARGLRPFILRRTKEEVASELPEKMEETVVCDLGKDQRKLYDELRDHYRQSLLGMVNDQGLSKSKMHVLEALLRLRQAACHPALLGRGEPNDSSAKLDFLCPHLEELIAEGHKTLVFSQFTSMLAIVRHHLDERGITYAYLDGQSRDRQESVERFQDDESCGIFLISLKAGGLGLNLTAADYVFLLDPWWNPAVEAQAIDRAHRVGQTRRVFAYRMICRDTVEEKIAELQKKKRKLADAILEADSGSVLKNMTADDLEMLLS